MVMSLPIFAHAEIERDMTRGTSQNRTNFDAKSRPFLVKRAIRAMCSSRTKNSPSMISSCALGHGFLMTNLPFSSSIIGAPRSLP